VWILGQRRQVFLQGCVASKDEGEALRRLAAQIDDVEGVVDQLMIGTTGAPPYPLAGR
jgi:osmotically-inducible protein OsmY